MRARHRIELHPPFFHCSKIHSRLFLLAKYAGRIPSAISYIRLSVNTPPLLLSLPPFSSDRQGTNTVLSPLYLLSSSLSTYSSKFAPFWSLTNSIADEGSNSTPLGMMTFSATACSHAHARFSSQRRQFALNIFSYEGQQKQHPLFLIFMITHRTMLIKILSPSPPLPFLSSRMARDEDDKRPRGARAIISWCMASSWRRALLGCTLGIFAMVWFVTHLASNMDGGSSGSSMLSTSTITNSRDKNANFTPFTASSLPPHIEGNTIMAEMPSVAAIPLKSVKSEDDVSTLEHASPLLRTTKEGETPPSYHLYLRKKIIMKVKVSGTTPSSRPSHPSTAAASARATRTTVTRTPLLRTLRRKTMRPLRP